MISNITYAIAECDNCDELYENSAGHSLFHLKTTVKDDVENEMLEDGWHKGDGIDGEKGKHYCPKCWDIDDNDVFHIKPKK